MTQYVIGSIDTPVYFAAWMLPYTGRGTFTPSESAAHHYEFMSVAVMELAKLTASDANAVALNLIVIPVAGKKVPKDANQMQLL